MLRSASEREKADGLIAALIRLHELSESQRDSVGVSAAEMLAVLQEENARLVEQVRWLAGKSFRPSREKALPGQMAFELLQMLLDARAAAQANPADENAGAPAEKADATEKEKPVRKRRGRDLPRKVVEHRVPEADRQCADCGRVETEIGFDKEERFVYQPAKVYILEERSYKYACRCGCGVTTAEALLPPKPIPGSMASSSLLAHLIVSKLLDGLPIERIAKQLRRHGVDLATSTLNDWMGRAAQMFLFLYALLEKELRQSALISLDDTPMPARSRDHPNGVQRGRQWIYLGDLDRIAFAEFTPDWKGTHPRRVLEGFRGHVQNDGYAGINPLFVGKDAPRRVGCNDHARRKFVEALEQRDGRAQGVIDFYRELYRLEAEAKADGKSQEALVAWRQAHSVPIWNRLATIIAELAPRAAPKTPLGKAVTYFQRQQPHLRAFLENGHLPISNAHVERQIRTVALFRKNSLFYGSVAAGERHAVLLTILLNCVLAGKNPYAYLVDIIDKIAAGWPAARAAELLPRNWADTQKPEQDLPGQLATDLR